MKSSILILLLCLSAAQAFAQTKPLEGKILDADNGSPIPGASIRIMGTQRGTYSSASGKFRLPLAEGQNQLRITSIGYKEKMITLSPGELTVTVSLTPSSLQIKGVEVTAGLSAEQIVSRAIARIKQYSTGLNTYEGLLYSKVVIETSEGSSASGDGSSGSISIGLGGRDTAEEANDIIMETFSKALYDKEKGVRYTIIQRRQTANVPSNSNILALGNFFSFYKTTIPLPGVQLSSPLGERALSDYNFSLQEKRALGDKLVYVIAIRPSSSLFPAFHGTMTILEESFDPVEISVKPSENTSVPTIRELGFTQKFEKLAENIWQPGYLQVTGRSNLEVIKGLLELGLGFNITSIYTDFKVNTPLPDTAFAPGTRIISVAPLADSTRPEFWQNNSLSELSQHEKAIYARTDSIMQKAEKEEEEEGVLSFLGIEPVLEFNRVGSVILGAGISPSPGPLETDLWGAYSFGLQRPLGTAEAAIRLLGDKRSFVKLRGEAFSRLGATSTDRTIPVILNTVTAALFHRDYYDYFREDGWNAGILAAYDALQASFSFENARHFAHSNTTARSIIVREEFRLNPLVQEGDFRTLGAAVQYDEIEQLFSFVAPRGLSLAAKLDGLYGEETRQNTVFRFLEGIAHMTVPSFPTGGYAPMYLRLGAYGGLGSDNLPVQYQFRMRTGSSILGGFGQFLSAPVGLFGGTRYHAFFAEHSFSDLLWRAVGLPEYEGRGIEMSIGAAAGKFEQTNSYGYRPTNGQWYAEAGFGLSRIPTFVSNLVFLSANFRWGIGPLGSGRTGMSIGVTTPF